MEIVKKDQLEEFPLLFQFCLRPGFNMTELKNHGYGYLDNYFWGMTDTRYNDIGWGGKNGTLTPEGLIIVRFCQLLYFHNNFRITEPELFGGVSLNTSDYFSDNGNWNYGAYKVNTFEKKRFSILHPVVSEKLKFQHRLTCRRNLGQLLRQLFKC